MSSSINNLNAPQMCSFFCSHHFNCIQNIYAFFINVIFAMCIMLYNFDCRRQWSKKWALAWAKISLNSFHTLNMTTFIHCSKDEFCSHKHGLNCTCIRQLFRRSFFDVFFAIRNAHFNILFCTCCCCFFSFGACYCSIYSRAPFTERFVHFSN